MNKTSPGYWYRFYRIENCFESSNVLKTINSDRKRAKDGTVPLSLLSALMLLDLNNILSRGCNTPFVGFGMIGTFVDIKPSEKALKASYQLIEYVKAIQSNPENDFEFITHDDAINYPDTSTLCPGEDLYQIWKEHDDFVNETSFCNCQR